MTLQFNNTVPTINELYDLIKKNIGSKYQCDLVHDRWNINFSAPKQCIMIKKSHAVGIGIFVNEKKNIIDVDGIVPNQILDRVVFGNYVTRLLLIPSWNKLEKEIGDTIKIELPLQQLQ